MTLTIEQLEIRRSGIGGSDAPVIAGVSKRRQPRELYHEKRGELDALPMADDTAWIGDQVEPVIGRWFAQETGLKVQRSHRTIRSREHPFALGHIDFRVLGAGERTGLEAKFRVYADEWGPTGSDIVPDDVIIQCEHYMGVLGWPTWRVCAWLGGREFRHYTIPRDQTLIDRLFELEAEFWNAVQRAEPPPVDFDHPTSLDLVKRLYPGFDGRAVRLPPELAHWRDVRADAKREIRRYEAVADGAEAHIRHAMGTAAIGVFPDGSAFKRKIVKRKAFNVDATEYVSFNFDKAFEVTK